MLLLQPRAQIQHSLDIYVATGCRTCAEALALAAVVANWNIRNLDIHIVDLGEPGAIRPQSVFAVPTYLLDGAVISLGNPGMDEIREQLDRIEEEDRCP